MLKHRGRSRSKGFWHWWKSFPMQYIMLKIWNVFSSVQLVQGRVWSTEYIHRNAGSVLYLDGCVFIFFLSFCYIPYWPRTWGYHLSRMSALFVTMCGSSLSYGVKHPQHTPGIKLQVPFCYKSGISVPDLSVALRGSLLVLMRALLLSVTHSCI